MSEELSRRRLLALAGPAALAAACGPPASQAPPTAELPLAALPEGERVVVWLGDEPVEVRREGDAVAARSLWCTHTGCRVVWNRATSRYDCLCHQASFDAAGRVLTGPPKRPLRDVPVRVIGDRVLVGLLERSAAS